MAYGGTHAGGELMSDWELVQVYRQGGHGGADAMGQLFLRHRPQLYRLALRIVGDASGAEDAVSEIWMRVMSCIGQYRHEAKFSTWLYRIAATWLIDWTRKSAAPLLPEPPGYADEDPDQQCEKAFTAELIQHTLEQLPPMQRTIIVMRDTDNIPLQEMAARLGLPLTALKSRLRRARTAFKRIAGQDHAIPGREAVGLIHLTARGALQ